MGATLDLPGVPGQGGLVLRNPNRPPVGASPFVGGATSSSPATRPRRIRQLLDEQVNPALASPAASPR